MRKWIKRLGIAIVSLLGVLALAAAGIYGASSHRLGRKFVIAPAAIAVPIDSASIAHGQHFATSISKCTQCHSADFGGAAFIDDPAFGRVIAPNLTRGRGGVGAMLTDTDWVRAIRHGVAPDGHGLLFIPSVDYQRMSDEDLGALVAYLKSLPPIDRDLGPSHLNMLPRTLLTVGKLPGPDAELIDHSVTHVAMVHPDTTATYGHYLSVIGGCSGCHNPNLSGGPIAGVPPGTPPAANLTPKGNLGKWTYEQFVQTLHTGKRPDGYTLNDFMPWRLAGQMTDDEMRAVWNYIRTVPPRELGQ